MSAIKSFHKSPSSYFFIQPSSDFHSYLLVVCYYAMQFKRLFGVVTWDYAFFLFRVTACF